MNFEIRKYEESDRLAVLLVWEQSVLATHQFLTPKDFDAIKSIVQQLQLGDLNLHCLVVDNKITGFISIIDYKIEMLFLAPDHIGRGLGKELLRFALQQYGASRVDVNEQNTPAVHFYLKSGFVVIERTAQDDLGFDYPLLKMQLQQPGN